jgi:hypothetical protein
MSDQQLLNTLRVGFSAFSNAPRPSPAVRQRTTRRSVQVQFVF